MVIITLFLTFFRIGAFSFGGGYAMIPLFEKELVTIHGWLNLGQLAEVLAISQMTPGPISINAATYVGYKVAGIPGSMAATLGLIAPSAIIVLIIARFFVRFQEHQIIQGVLKGLRPVAVALIIVAGIQLGRTSLTDFRSLLIGGVALAGVLSKRVHPIYIIILAGIMGFFLY
ncbi:MAG: chromate transporter [Bacillota bacterium]